MRPGNPSTGTYSTPAPRRCNRCWAAAATAARGSASFRRRPALDGTRIANRKGANAAPFFISIRGVRFLSRLHLDRIAQHVAAAPHGLDVIVAVGRGGELLAQLADEDVDDLELGLVHAAIKVVEEHLLRQRRARA